MNEHLQPHVYVECKDYHIVPLPEHCAECKLDPDNAIHRLPEAAASPLTAVAGLFLAILCIVLTCSSQAQGTSTLQHGHLFNAPFIFEADGTKVTSERHAFLAIKVENLPSTDERKNHPERIDYVQSVDFLVADGFFLPVGADLHRSIYTTAADADGWFLLKVSKPCSPGERSTDVGLILVCPPSAGEAVAACSDPSRGIQPLFNGVPPEIVPCPNQRRQAVRK